MPTIIEYLITWIGNGIATAFLLIINDMLFKKQVQKWVDKAIEKSKLVFKNGEHHV